MMRRRKARADAIQRSFAFPINHAEENEQLSSAEF